MKLCREGNPGWVGQTTFWCEYGNPVLDAIFSFDWTRKACVACPHPLLMNGNPVLNVPSFLSKMEVLYCQLYPICLKQENLLFVHVKRSSSYTSRFISRLKGRPVQNAPSSLLVKGCPVKEVCHKIFEPYFFHDSYPSGPLINSLKYFSNSVSILPRYSITKWFLRCATYGKDKLPSAETKSNSSLVSACF